MESFEKEKNSANKNNNNKRKKKIKKKSFKIIWQRLIDRHPYVIKTIWVIIIAIIIMIILETLFFYRKLYDEDFYKNAKDKIESVK